MRFELGLRLVRRFSSGCSNRRFRGHELGLRFGYRWRRRVGRGHGLGEGFICFVGHGAAAPEIRDAHGADPEAGVFSIRVLDGDSQVVLTRRPLDKHAEAAIILGPHRPQRAARAHAALIELDADDRIRTDAAAVHRRDLDDERDLGVAVDLSQGLQLDPHRDRRGGSNGHNAGYQDDQRMLAFHHRLLPRRLSHESLASR